MICNPPRIRHASREAPHQADRPSNTKVSIAELLGLVAVLGVVTATPWLFGGVQSGVQVWLFAGVLIALACCLIKQLAGGAASTRWPVAVVPLIGAIGLGVFQLVPLDAGTTASLSPAGTELRSWLLPTQASPDAALERNVGIAAAGVRQPLSLYPASTRRDLAVLVLAVAVFILGSVLFTTPRAQLWLCGLVALNGAALAFFGLVQQLTWNGLLYWTVPLSMGGGPFGPFVNKNNAGGFLNLCLACGVGMTVWAVGRHRPDYSDRGMAYLDEKRSFPAQAWRQLTGFVARLNAWTVAALSLTGCIVGGILCSLSRGSGIAMIGATVLTTLFVLCARRRSVRLWAIGLAAAAGLGLVSWVGMTDAVRARFATLLDQETVTQNRIPHWRDGMKAAGDFWPLGSGLGTYRYVYRPYEERSSQVWYYHAENQYLEALVEGGIVGLGLMLAMIGLVGAAAWRLLRDDPDARSFAFGVAGVFALSGQVICGFFDFGLYVPANVLLFALLCGAVSGRAAGLTKGPRADPSPPTPLPASGARGAALGGVWQFFGRGRVLSPLVTASILGATVWGSLETRCVAAVETTLKNVRLTQPPNEVSPGALAAAIREVEAALERREDDAEAQHRMATLWLHLYRASAYRQLREEMASGSDDPRLWQATSQIVLHGRAQYFVRNKLLSELEKLRGEPVVKENLTPALKHLVLARRACPLLAEVHVTLGELCVLAADPAGDRVHIERARRLAPSDADLLFRCGLLDLQAGRIESASASWQQSLALSRRYLDDVLLLAGQELSPSQMVERVLPDSPELLIELAQGRYRGKEHAAIRRMLADRAERLIGRVELPEEEQYYLRASARALKELYPEAIADYVRAVELRPQKVGWRYQLALLLEREGRISEAHEQAKLCARMDPHNGKYRSLLRELNHTRLTTTTSLD